MAIIHLAYTAPVNPSGATPTLSQAQLWAGFQRKVRKPSDFVPVIASAEVTKEEGNVVTRTVTFKEGRPGAHGGSAGDQVVEVCSSYAPCRVDYAVSDGSSVSNIISQGPGGELFVTYAFAWKHEGMEEGGKEFEEAKAKHEQVSDLEHQRLAILAPILMLMLVYRLPRWPSSPPLRRSAN